MGPFDTRKIIIDCSGELEDILVLLSSLATSPSALQVLLISVTNLNGRTEYGLNNVVSMFQHLKDELSWRRRKNYHSLGYRGVGDLSNRPTVAIGCNRPLDTSTPDSDYDEAITKIWQSVHLGHVSTSQDSSLFVASRRPAHEEILQVLRDNEPGSITLVAIGPLTTIATASRLDPDTFLRTKDLLVTGGTMDAAEILARPGKTISQDPLAAAQLFALTSTTPSSTMPQTTGYRCNVDSLPQLRILLFPQSSTKDYSLERTQLQPYAALGNDSPLVLWIKPSLEQPDDDDAQPGRLHVPGYMPVNYAASSYDYEWRWHGTTDIRVDLTGETKGLYVVDNSNVSTGNRLLICSNEPSHFGLILVSQIFAKVDQQSSL